jgi:hypothetical protein
VLALSRLAGFSRQCDHDWSYGVRHKTRADDDTPTGAVAPAFSMASVPVDNALHAWRSPIEPYWTPSSCLRITLVACSYFKALEQDIIAGVKEMVDRLWTCNSH